MTIQYFTKHVYGNELIYLADSDAANDWRRLTGKLTITKSDMTNLATLVGSTADDMFERVFEPANALAGRF